MTDSSNPWARRFVQDFRDATECTESFQQVFEDEEITPQRLFSSEIQQQKYGLATPVPIDDERLLHAGPYEKSTRPIDPGHDLSDL
eukprot:3547963-Pyramimonas_sp.AAC.1